MELFFIFSFAKVVYWGVTALSSPESVLLTEGSSCSLGRVMLGRAVAMGVLEGRIVGAAVGVAIAPAWFSLELLLEGSS